MSQAILSHEPAVALHNVLEPAALIEHFLQAPPSGFRALRAPGGAPAFATRFDLLTTLAPTARRRIDALPLARHWRNWLHPLTCFIGTTVSEYAPLPASSPEAWVREVIGELAPRYSFVIIKDVPTEAVLAGDAAGAHAARVLEACRARGFVIVEGQALAYVPIDFTSIDDFLARLSRARRKDIKRKLRKRGEIEIQALATGNWVFADEEMLRMLYALYLNVYRQSDIHFDLLTPEFFRLMLQDPASDGVVFTYRTRGELIGYNICFAQNGMLLDKYVGFVYPQARHYNLYVVSWLHNLEYARARGLRYYVAGWTDPEIKRALGARFTFTRHAVYVRNRALRSAAAPFKRFFEADREWHAAHVVRADP